MRSATRRSTSRKEASESDHGGDLNIELMTDETLGSEEKSVWTGMCSTGHHEGEKLNHVELM